MKPSMVIYENDPTQRALAIQALTKDIEERRAASGESLECVVSTSLVISVAASMVSGAKLENVLAIGEDFLEAYRALAVKALMNSPRRVGFLN